MKIKITPEEYMAQREELDAQIDECQNKREDLEERARKYFPKKSELRPAKPSDIVEGAILYYPKDEHGDAFWQIVEEVINPRDSFKAYCAEDGCRYGIEGAHVRAEAKPSKSFEAGGTGF